MKKDEMVEKAQVYQEMMEIDPFEFDSLDEFEPEVVTGLKKLKKKIWLYIVYPESAPEDWIESMKLTGIQFALSPLHDKDLDVMGNLKKPHWHMIVIFDGPTTFMTASSFRSITKGPYPKACQGLRGAYDYFTHANDVDKAQYEKKDIQHFNGFEMELSMKDSFKMKKELIEIIIKENILSYMQFNLNVMYYLEYEYYLIVANNAFYFNTLISSYARSPEKSKQMYKNHIDELELENKKTEETKENK